MRFLSAWACGVCSTWAYVAWLDGNTTMLWFALAGVVITFGQAMYKETMVNRVVEKAVKQLYRSLQDKDSEVYKEFKAGLDEGIKEAQSRQ